jgi:hypothetical protein
MMDADQPTVSDADQPTAAALTHVGNLYDEAIAELIDRNQELGAEIERLRAIEARYAECVADATQMSQRAEEMGAEVERLNSDYDELERLRAVQSVARRIVSDAFAATTVRHRTMSMYWIDPAEMAALRALVSPRGEG